MPANPREALAALLSSEVLALIDACVREIAVGVAREELANALMQKRSWYSVEEAASRLGISPAAVRMRAKRGRLATRRQGRRLYVAAASVDELEPASSAMLRHGSRIENGSGAGGRPPGARPQEAELL